MHEHVFGQKEDPYTESKGVRPRVLGTTEEGGRPQLSQHEYGSVRVSTCFAQSNQ